MLDYFGMFIHGFTQTHIDALCHLSVEEGGAFWNGKAFGALAHARRAHRHHRLLA